MWQSASSLGSTSTIPWPAHRPARKHTTSTTSTFYLKSHYSRNGISTTHEVNFFISDDHPGEGECPVSADSNLAVSASQLWPNNAGAPPPPRLTDLVMCLIPGLFYIMLRIESEKFICYVINIAPCQFRCHQASLGISLQTTMFQSK